jgi:hypothetical protein
MHFKSSWIWITPTYQLWICRQTGIKAIISQWNRWNNPSRRYISFKCWYLVALTTKHNSISLKIITFEIRVLNPRFIVLFLLLLNSGLNWNNSCWWLCKCYIGIICSSLWCEKYTVEFSQTLQETKPGYQMSYVKTQYDHISFDLGKTLDGRPKGSCR